MAPGAGAGIERLRQVFERGFTAADVADPLLCFFSRREKPDIDTVRGVARGSRCMAASSSAPARRH